MTLSTQSKIIGEMQPLFRFPEYDPFMIDGNECPLYIYIDVNEENALFYELYEISGETQKKIYIDTIRKEAEIKKVLSNKYPLIRILKLRVQNHKLNPQTNKKELIELITAKIYELLQQVYSTGEYKEHIQTDIDPRIVRIRKKRERQKQLEQLLIESEEHQKIYEEIIKNPLTAIKNACEYKGIVREEKNKVALFLLGLLGKYSGAVWIRGETSTGKSHLMRNVLKLFPGDYYFSYSSTSNLGMLYAEDEEQIPQEAEIIYAPEEFISNKFVEGFKRALTNIDDEEFKHITSEPDKWGARKSRILKAKHRAHWTTATMSDINEENLNRGFTLSTEDSAKKIESVLRFKTAYSKFGIVPNHEAFFEVFNIWRDELLDRRREVVNGKLWALETFLDYEFLTIPLSNPAVMRHYDKIRKVAISMAIVNNRPILENQGERFILVEPADVILTLELFREILTDTMTNLHKGHKEVYEAAIKTIENSSEGLVTVNEVHENIKSKSIETVRTYLNTLVKNNFLAYKKDKDGKTNLYYLTDESLDKMIFFKVEKITELWTKWFEEEFPENIQEQLKQLGEGYVTGEIFLEHLKNLKFLGQPIQLKKEIGTKGQSLLEHFDKNQNNRNPSLQDILDACKYLDERHRPGFQIEVLQNYLEFEGKQISKAKLERIVNKLVQQGLLYEPQQHFFRVVEK